MAIPVLILAGTAIASTSALVYDWVKSVTSGPVVNIEQATVETDEQTDVQKAHTVLKYVLLAAGAWVVYKKMIK